VTSTPEPSRFGVTVRVLAAAVGGLVAAGLVAAAPSDGFRSLVLGCCAWVLALLLIRSACRAVAGRGFGRSRLARQLLLAGLGTTALVCATALAVTPVDVTDPFFVPAGTNCGSAVAPLGENLRSDLTPDALTAGTFVNLECEPAIHLRQGQSLLFLQIGLALCTLAVLTLGRPTRSNVDRPPLDLADV
jgi:hypothetical protein